MDAAATVTESLQVGTTPMPSCTSGQRQVIISLILRIAGCQPLRLEGSTLRRPQSDRMTPRRHSQGDMPTHRLLGRTDSRYRGAGSVVGNTGMYQPQRGG